MLLRKYKHFGNIKYIKLLKYSLVHVAWKQSATLGEDESIAALRVICAWAGDGEGGDRQPHGPFPNRRNPMEVEKW